LASFDFTKSRHGDFGPLREVGLGQSALLTQIDHRKAHSLKARRILFRQLSASSGHPLRLDNRSRRQKAGVSKPSELVRHLANFQFAKVTGKFCP